MIKLTTKQKLALKEHEDILRKVCFNAYRSTFVDSATTTRLATLYKDITGSTADCKVCADKSFIKRLSFWYCGNRDGILPETDTPADKSKNRVTKQTTKTKKQSQS